MTEKEQSVNHSPNSKEIFWEVTEDEQSVTTVQILRKDFYRGQQMNEIFTTESPDSKKRLWEVREDEQNAAIAQPSNFNNKDFVKILFTI